MTYQLASVSLTPGRKCQHVVIVDIENRRAFVLWKPGGELEPAAPQSEFLIDRNGLTDPADIAASAFASSTTASIKLHRRTFSAVEQATEAADTLLSRANNGRELNPDLPSNLVASVRDLSVQVDTLRRSVTDEFDSLDQQVRELEYTLHRPIVLPDRTGNGPVDPCIDEHDDRDKLAEFLDANPPAESTAPAPARAATTARVQKKFAPGAATTGRQKPSNTSRPVSAAKSTAAAKSDQATSAAICGQISVIHPGGYGFLQLDSGQTAYLPREECISLAAAAREGTRVVVGMLEAGNPNPVARQVGHAPGRA